MFKLSCQIFQTAVLSVLYNFIFGSAGPIFESKFSSGTVSARGYPDWHFPRPNRNLNRSGTIGNVSCVERLFLTLYGLPNEISHLFRANENFWLISENISLVALQILKRKRVFSNTRSWSELSRDRAGTLAANPFSIFVSQDTSFWNFTKFRTKINFFRVNFIDSSRKVIGHCFSLRNLVSAYVIVRNFLRGF